MESDGVLSNLVYVVKEAESEQNLTVIISRQITSSGDSVATPGKHMHAPWRRFYK